MQRLKLLLPSPNEIYLSAAVGGIGVIASKIFGEFNDSLLSLIILMIVDFITGLMVAAIFNKSTKTFSGGLSSKICLQGVAKKIAILLLVAVGFQIEILLENKYPIRTFITWGLCTGEVISIIENSVRMGILPKNVQKIFEKAIGILNHKIDDSNIIQIESEDE